MKIFKQLDSSNYYLFCYICNKTNLSQYRYYIEGESHFYCKKCKEDIENGNK